MPGDADRRLLVVLFALGAAAMLLGALGDREYSYYTLLRAAVCVAAVLVCVLAFRWRQLWAVGIFAFIAILFNPVAPVELSKSLWRPIDVGVANLFVLAAAFVAPPGQLAKPPGRKRVAIPLAIGMVLAVTLGAAAYGVDQDRKTPRLSSKYVEQVASSFWWEKAGWGPTAWEVTYGGGGSAVRAVRCLDCKR